MHFLTGKHYSPTVLLTAALLFLGFMNTAQAKQGEQIIDETKSCLEECDFGRFVSAAAAPDKIAGLSARIRENIETLEKATTER